ncbi:MAG: membrane protein insertase YidC [Candidatus Aminicenantes bacterium]|nr:membrane protein insertase YidC [Candidatus Aminicenantes bacterium]
MDTKKLILAIALSIIVITLYQYFFMPKPAVKANVPVEAGVVPTTIPPVSAEKSDESGSKSLSDIFSKTKKEEKVEEIKVEPVASDVVGNVEKDIVVETNLFTAVFTNRGGGLKSFVLKKYKDDLKNPLNLISEKVNDEIGGDKYLPFYFSIFYQEEYVKELNRNLFGHSGTGTMIVSGNIEKELVFKYSSVEKNISVEKRFFFRNDSYVIGMKISVVKDGKPISIPLVFGPDLENHIGAQRAQTSSLILKGFDGTDIQDLKFSGVKRQKLGAGIESGEGTFNGFFYWIAYERPYFAAMIRMARRDAPLKYYTVQREEEKGIKKDYSFITFSDPVSVYFGPKDEKELEKVEAIFPESNKVIDYGWAIFGAIAKIMLKGLTFIHQYIPNYGWALVVFTLFIKILLFPLTYASSVSMAKMQTLQPKIKAIKKKYKNLKDPEQRKKMNAETMALYKTEKVNPAGGCLPLLLQMPVFFGLFRLLQTSISIRHEPWILWITDLSLKDAFYVLPILMGVTQIIVSKMSPTTADSSQKKMMYIMPVVMVFLFMNFSSGLNLYWFVSNLLQIGQQHIINKKIFSEKKREDAEKKTLKRKKRGA